MHQYLVTRRARTSAAWCYWRQILQNTSWCAGLTMHMLEYDSVATEGYWWITQIWVCSTNKATVKIAVTYWSIIVNNTAHIKVTLKRSSFLLISSFIMNNMFLTSLVAYCDVFISCLDSHSDGTHSLQSIHWWASNATYIAVPMENKSHIHLGWSKGEEMFSNFNFWGELFL